ncbi:unnamed protein product [Penicillium pancosmium]
MSRVTSEWGPIWQQEIQRLRLEIHGLQGQPASCKAQEQRPEKYPSPPESHVLSSTSTPEVSLQSPQTNDIRIVSPQTWNGVDIPDIRTGNLIHYGPLSSSYFGARLGFYLAETKAQLHSEILFPGDTSRLSCTPNLLAPEARPQSSTVSLGGDSEQLSRAQEEQFLDLYWQSFHCIYPIIGEAEFRNYYDSLWNDFIFPPTRKPSPLVDSIMAICMQYGSTFLISDDDMLSTDDVDHVKVALRNSYALYCRSQCLLLAEIENPSMMTLQSYIYCTIYLYNTSLLNAAYAMLGNASKVAQTIGLQLQPASITSVPNRQLRARVWSVMAMIDSQLSMALGRPATINVEQRNLGPPGHIQEHASLSGSMLTSPNHDDITWLSFHANCAYLVNSVQHIQYNFSKRVIQAQEQHAVKSFYDSPVALEELARFLGREVRCVYEWAENVPESLKIPRKGSGESFSTERTLLKFDTFSPIWLQRQRLLLEILYHHLQLSNFRSFLRLPPGSSFITPLSDCHSINCLNHAISLTNIIHQVLTDTDLLRGWSPVIQYQWDSALCILGFTLTNPVCPPSPTARKCLQTAISSFEIMGKYFAASREAAQLMRRFASQAEMLVQQFHNNLSSRRLDSRDGSGQIVTPAARSSTTAAVQILAAPALTPEYIQKCPSAGLDFSSFVGGSGIGGNEFFTLDGLRNVSTGIINGPSVLGGISGDLTSEVDYSWISGDGIID